MTGKRLLTVLGHVGQGLRAELPQPRSKFIRGAMPRRMTTKTKIAAAAALATLVIAPGLASAQSFFTAYPSAYPRPENQVAHNVYRPNMEALSGAHSSPGKHARDRGAGVETCAYQYQAGPKSSLWTCRPEYEQSRPGGMYR